MRWHRLAWLLGLVLLTAGLAGCIGGSGDDGGEGDTGTPDTDGGGGEPIDATNATGAAGPRIVNASHEGTTQGLDVPAAGTLCAGDCDNTLEFEVEENATAVVAELAWEGGEGLILDVTHPLGETCEPSTPAGLLFDCRVASASGASPLRLEITDDAILSTTGTWTARAWAQQSPQAAVAFTLYVSVVYDGELPEGLSQVEG